MDKNENKIVYDNGNEFIHEPGSSKYVFISKAPVRKSKKANYKYPWIGKQNSSKAKKKQVVIDNRPLGSIKGDTIGFKDFLVRSDLRKCFNRDHVLIDIMAHVYYLSPFDEIKSLTVPAAYCKNCDAYFILDYDYQDIKKKGILLCRVVDLNTFNRKDYIADENLKQESILTQYGYNVNSTKNLTPIKRHIILALLADYKVSTHIQMRNHISWLIRMHEKRKDKDFSKAIQKWKADRSFISQYKTGSFTKVGIKSIVKK